MSGLKNGVNTVSSPYNGENVIKLNESVQKIPCVIQKQPSNNNLYAEPIIHKNILAQMLYEISNSYFYEILNVIPVVIVLEENVVDGISETGVYQLDVKNNQYVCKIGFEKNPNMMEMFQTLLEKNKYRSRLGIGYMVRFDPKEFSSYELENIVNESMTLIKNLNSMLEIHGELTSYVIEHLEKDFILAQDYDDIYYVFSFTQWIKSVQNH